jgi:hypothetical protein
MENKIAFQIKAEYIEMNYFESASMIEKRVKIN